MRIALDPRVREVVEIDGAKFTIKPMTAAMRLQMSFDGLTGGVKAWDFIIKASTFAIEGIEWPDGKQVTLDEFTADMLSVESLTTLLTRIQSISGIGDTERKNS